MEHLLTGGLAIITILLAGISLFHVITEPTVLWCMAFITNAYAGYFLMELLKSND